MRNGWHQAAWWLVVGLVAGCSHKPRPFEEAVRKQADRPIVDRQSPAAKASPAVSGTPTTQPVAQAPKRPVPPSPVGDLTPPKAVAPASRPVAVLQELEHPIEPHASEKGPKIPLLIIDGAVRRDWPPSIAYRPSGDVRAGHTYWPGVEKYSRRSDLLNWFWESGEFLFNSMALPVRAVLAPPWTSKIYSPVGPPGQEHVDSGQPEMKPLLPSVPAPK